jgi:SAM-dependent methyltransferase
VAERMTIPSALHRWWRENYRRRGFGGALRMFSREMAEFIRDSTPERRRGRYGDVEWDCETGANTTSANVNWRDRLVTVLVGPGYQPCDPDLFRETLDLLDADFRSFTFVDIGSGKGRALLMAAEYGFRRVVGVELLPQLHAIAQQNIRNFDEARQMAGEVVSLCMDAADFEFPPEPLVVFLFNPLPEPALQDVLARLGESLDRRPRTAYVVYHNPVLEHVLSNDRRWQRVTGNMQYCLYRNRM